MSSNSKRESCKRETVNINDNKIIHIEDNDSYDTYNKYDEEDDDDDNNDKKIVITK